MRDLYLGIDLGGTGIRSAVFNRTGMTMLEFGDINFKSEPNNKELADSLNPIIKNAIDNCKITAWGLASPGPLDPFKGVIETPPNLKVRNFSVVKYFKNLYPSVPGFLINDADAALLAEYRYGAAQGFNHVVGVFAGTGLGSAVISNGRLQRGRGKGPEWSHTSIYGFGQKRQCVCGRTNCLEIFVGTMGLAQTYCQIFKLDYKTLTREEIFNISIKAHEGLKNKTGDQEAYKSVLGAYTIHLLEGLKNITCVHNPDCIILGGGIIKNNPFLIRVLRKLIELINDDTKPLFEKLVIKLPKYDNPGTLGAAVYAIDGIDRIRLGGGIIL